MEPVNAHSAGSFVGQFGLSHCQLFPAAAKRAECGAVIGTAMRRPHSLHLIYCFVYGRIVPFFSTTPTRS